MKKLILIVLCLSFFSVPQASALKIGGVTLSESLTAESAQLVLNGAGLRKKFFIKIYAGALYLKKRTSDPKTIIDADEEMAIRMHWIRDGVPVEKIIAGWNTGFETGMDGNLTAFKTQIDQFNSFFTVDAKANDIYDIIYTPAKGVQVLINGKLKGSIKGFPFKKAVFSIWLGNNKELGSVKTGMLGK
ncbi:chalcone isomerase [Candidatus Magnetomorum sp. HK-1]|nr:chalcone isomerase [Candidatus Magnetomorum sp. HK-1]